MLLSTNKAALTNCLHLWSKWWCTYFLSSDDLVCMCPFWKRICGSQQWGSMWPVTVPILLSMCSSFPCSASFLPASCVAGCYTSADLHCKLHSKQIALKDILEWRQSPLLSQEGCPDVSDKAMGPTRPCSKSHFDILGNTQVCTQKKIDLGVFSLA